MATSESEQIAHVARRLGLGANPALIAASTDVDDAVARAIAPAGDAGPPRLRIPPDWESAYEEAYAPSERVGVWWLQQMVGSSSPIRERLTWFWHDHFAISSEKVDVGWMLWDHLTTLRTHATGNFAELVHAISIDAGMLWYLDGDANTAAETNENFGRELLELHTLGIGNYTQDDVVAASRACTGWDINFPQAQDRPGFHTNAVEGWASYFRPENHDGQIKTFLGRRGNWQMKDIIDICLAQPETARFVAGKLFRELVGLDADEATLERLASQFSGEWGWEIMPLVEAIVAHPAFLSDEAVWSKVRTPLEKGVSLYQGFGDFLPQQIWDYNKYFWTLVETRYYPFGAPNPAGYLKDDRLLSPSVMMQAFHLLWPLNEPDPAWTVDDVTARLGLFDLAPTTRSVLEGAGPAELVALAFTCPEFAAT